MGGVTREKFNEKQKFLRRSHILSVIGGDSWQFFDMAVAFRKAIIHQICAPEFLEQTAKWEATGGEVDTSKPRDDEVDDVVK